MIYRHSLIMIGMAFTCGLLFGLVLHLPQVTAPASGRHIRDIAEKEASVSKFEDDVGDHVVRELPKYRENLHTLLKQSFSQDADQKESASVRRANPEMKYNADSDMYNQNVPRNQHNIERDQNKKYHIEDQMRSDIDNAEIEIEPLERRGDLKPKTQSVDLSNGHRNGNKKHSSMIDIPPSSSQQKQDDKLKLSPSAKISNNPSQHPSGHESDRTLHGQFGHLWETVESIYWSPQLERLTPVAFSDTQAAQWRHKVDVGRINRITEGCGRMQNRLVVFDDGSQMCARYRINNDQIQGEVYSYYLAQVLGIDNVPPAILDRPDSETRRWEYVIQDIDSAKWNPRKIMVLTPHVRDLRKAYIPPELRSEERNLAPDTKTLVNKTIDELTELVQWSDLIILDYLTANVDRVVNNMFNLQWSPGMMSAPTHNLERAGEAGSLIFMDNESGLLHSYRLLDKYSHYHDKLLRSLCIFRRSTVSAIKKYHKTGTLYNKITELFRQRDPLAEKLSSLPTGNIQTLNQRLAAVYKQIVHCEHKYTQR